MVHGSTRSVYWRILAAVLSLALVFSLAACGAEETGEGTSAEETPVEVTKMVLASTTSTQDSGLFDVLIPAFQDANPEYEVEVVAVGSGEAIELGMNGDADVLLVHSPKAEASFVASGYADTRYDVMYNDFVVVGPPADAAAIKGMTDASDAFTKIANAKAEFASRGDESGTHAKEKTIWTEAGIDPNGQSWYLSTGQGMGDTLTFSNEKPAYTLSDRATYLSMKENLTLEIFVEGDKALLNQYGVLVVKNAANLSGAEAFQEWILSPEGQEVIGSFGVEKFGEPLFTPNAQ